MSRNKTKYLPGLVILSLFLFALSLAAYAQDDVTFIHMDKKVGLADNSVRCIFQDSFGFIWIGTSSGLNYYDGNQFQLLRAEEGNTNTLTDSEINVIVEDSQGDLWIGTVNGLNKLEVKTRKISQYFHDPEDENSISNNYIRSLLFDKKGRLWIGTRDGLSVLDVEQQGFKRYKQNQEDPTALTGYSVYDLYEDSRGDIWVGTRGNTLHKYNEAANNFTRYEVPMEYRVRLTEGPRSSGFSIFEDSSGQIWTSNSTYGLYQFDREAGQFRPFNQELNELLNQDKRVVRTIVEDNDGDLWLATNGGGLIRINIEEKSFRKYTYDPYNKKSIHDNYISTIIKDTSGLLWVGLQSEGLIKVRKNSIPGILYQPSDSLSISSREVLTIFEDREKILWVGMRGSFDRIDLETQERKSYYVLESESEKLEIRTVYWIYEEDPDHLLIGGSAIGLIRFNKKDETFHRILDVYRAKHIVKDKDGNLWIAASYSGLYKLDYKSGSIGHITTDSYKEFKLGNKSVDVLAITPDNHIWVGTSEGLYELDPASSQARFHSTAIIDGLKKAITEIQCFCVTQSGNFWTGTDKGGLLKYSFESQSFKSIAFQNNIYFGEIEAILEDYKGYLWLSTNNGIFKFNPQTSLITHFDESQGIQGADFKTNSAYKGNDNRLYFGGRNGFNIIDPDNKKPDEFDPPNYITSFSTRDKTRKPFRGISGEESLNVSHKDRDINIEFTSLDYSLNGSQQYIYKLIGYDKKWNEIIDGNRVSYTNLPARNYTFRVKSRSRSGVWSDNEASVKFIVLQPFWETWWFRSLVVLLLAGLISGLVYLRFKVSEKQRVKLEKIVEERTNELEVARKTLQSELHQRKKAEQVLLEERGVFIGGPVTVFRLGKKISAPAEYVSENIRQFGFVNKDFTSGKISVLDLIHPDDYKRVRRAILKAAISGSTALEIEFRIINAHGRIRWIHQFTIINRDAAGNVTNFVGYDLDITDRKHVEQNLTEERNIFIGGPVQVLKIGPDLTKPAEYLSQNVRGFGYESTDWTSGSISVKELIHPDDYKRIIKEYIRATRSGAASFESEFRIFAKDGKEKWVYQFMVIMRDEHGKVANYLGYYLDITERKQAEQALLEERNLFIGGPVVVFKAKMNILRTAEYVSPNIVQFGYTIEDWLSGKVGLKNIIHPDDFKMVLSKIIKAPKTGKTSLDMEFRIVLPDGSCRWVYQFIVVVRHGSGKAQYYYGYVLDITERKRAQITVRESEEKYRNLVETAQDSILIMEPESEKIIYANPVAEEMYGYSVKELQTMSLKDLADEAENGERKLNEILKNGSSKNFENIHRQKNGDRIFVLLSGSVIHYGGNKSLFVIIRDITVRKKAEEELWLAHNALENRVEERTEELVKINERLMGEISERIRTQQALQESEERFRSLFENATIGIYRTAPSGEILLANPALVRMLGYDSFAELSVRNLGEEGFQPEYSREEFLERLENGVEIRGLEASWKRRDGSIIYVRESASPIKDTNGVILYIEGTVEDITEMKIAEEQAKERQKQLMQADKMVSLGTLISGIAHEINNPNLFINSNSTVLKKMWSSALPILESYYRENGDFRFGGTKYSKARDVIQELLSGIREGSDRIRNIVSELRDFAGEGRAEMSETVDINAVLKSATTIVFNLIKNSSNKFSVSYEKDLPFLTGNYQRLEQVLINLLTNACHSLPNKNCAIEITTSYDKKNKRVLVKVRDEGVGIPQGLISRITEPFYTTRSKSGGTGLGLSISNTIIKEHGGELYHESEPDSGTTAIIVLPLNGKKD